MLKFCEKRNRRVCEGRFLTLLPRKRWGAWLAEGQPVGGLSE